MKHKLLYAGEVLDLEAIAAAPKIGYFIGGLRNGEAARVLSPCHGVHNVTTVFLHSATDEEGVLVYFTSSQARPFGKNEIRGCGFCQQGPDSDLMPLRFIKTNARQALERLRARLDAGVSL